MPEYAHLFRFFRPAQDPVVRDVAPEQKPAVTEPNRTFPPTRAGIQALDRRIEADHLAEPGIDHFYPRIRIMDDSSALFCKSD
jgi:hypothetical protein